jgi:hypothetical protein
MRNIAGKNEKFDAIKLQIYGYEGGGDFIRYLKGTVRRDLTGV